MALTEKFPVADIGEVAQPPEVMPLDWELRLSEGREIFLTYIQQHRTYGGMLTPSRFDSKHNFPVLTDAFKSQVSSQFTSSLLAFTAALV
jgi:hypothetical protein